MKKMTAVTVVLVLAVMVLTSVTASAGLLDRHQGVVDPTPVWERITGQGGIPFDMPVFWMMLLYLLGEEAAKVFK